MADFTVRIVRTLPSPSSTAPSSDMGPTVNRILTESAEDVGRYLLDEPPTTIRVGLDDGESIVILLGTDTPDRRNYYAMREGSSQIVLIDHLWGDVLIELATDPPYEP